MIRLILAGVCCSALFAQETRLGADFRLEGEALKASCSSFSSIVGCGEVLFTDHPMHIAVGSLAPKNGVGFGPAFVTHWTPNESWRLSWDMDAVATTNGSWRAGAYMTAVWTRHRKIAVNSASGSNLAVTEYPAFHAYAQGASLDKLENFNFPTGQFGMTQTIVGANAVFPVLPKLKMSLLEEMNGRFVDLRPSFGSQPKYVQFGQGVRLRPEIAAGFLRLNYSVNFQEFLANASNSSFQRLTFDFGHEIPIYRKMRTAEPRDFNGPDDCSAGTTLHRCPPVGTRNREGSFGIRFLMTQSFGNVPFYFQPTLGGSDINGFTALGSFQDYRFRGPNDILVRASVEHSIWGPIGAAAMIDEGKVAFSRGDLDFSHLQHSYAAGLTLRAGGFPMVYVLFAWGGGQGVRTIANINTSLLGGSARPSLY